MIQGHAETIGGLTDLLLDPLGQLVRPVEDSLARHTYSAADLGHTPECDDSGFLVHAGIQPDLRNAVKMKIILDVVADASYNITTTRQNAKTEGKKMSNLNISSNAELAGRILFPDHRHIERAVESAVYGMFVEEAEDQLFGAMMMAEVGSDDEAWLSYLRDTAKDLARYAEDRRWEEGRM